MRPMLLRSFDSAPLGYTDKTQMVTIQTDPLAARTQKKFLWMPSLARRGSEYSLTFITEFVVMASQIFVYKLAAHYLGTQGFSEYAIVRRTIAFLVPLPGLGLNVALPRYIAYAGSKSQPEKASRYFRAAILCVGTATLLLTALINTFPSYLSYVFFGSATYQYLARPVSWLIGGLVLHSLVYSFFRGLLDMRRANLLQFINLGIVPLIAFIPFHSNLIGALTTIGVLSIAVAGSQLPFVLRSGFEANIGVEARQLLRYGLQRLPGDFIQMALLAVPATIVAHLQGIQEAGFVAFGISVLTMTGAMFSPIGLILLPKASLMFADGRVEELRRHVRGLIGSTLLLSAYFVAGILLLGPFLIHLYLGPGFQGAGLTLKLIAPAVVPFCLYVVLRNVVDAFHVNAINARNLLFSFTVFSAWAACAFRFSPHVGSILVALTGSIVVLAGLTLLETRRIMA